MANPNVAVYIKDKVLYSLINTGYCDGYIGKFIQTNDGWVPVKLITIGQDRYVKTDIIRSHLKSSAAKLQHQGFIDCTTDSRYDNLKTLDLNSSFDWSQTDEITLK